MGLSPPVLQAPRVLLADPARRALVAMLPALGVTREATTLRWEDESLRGAALLGWALHFVECPRDVASATLSHDDVRREGVWAGRFIDVLHMSLRARALTAVAAAVFGTSGIIASHMAALGAELLEKLIAANAREGDPTDLLYASRGEAREGDGAAEACALLAVLVRAEPREAALVCRNTVVCGVRWGWGEEG